MNSSLPKLKVKRLTPNAYLPILGTENAAGYDLFSIDQVFIQPQERVLVSTGLAMQFPIGTYGLIAPRSGLAYKNSLDVGGGKIDPDYRGEIKIILFNFGQDQIQVNVGDRIAQLIIKEYQQDIEVEEHETLNETKRGDKGINMYIS